MDPRSRVDGLVIAKSQRRERALLKAAVEAQLPIVIIAPDEISTDVQVVRCNNVAAGTTVASHLAGLGHRSIGFAGGPEHSIDSKHRLRGLRDELARRVIHWNRQTVHVRSFTRSGRGSPTALRSDRTSRRVLATRARVGAARRAAARGPHAAGALVIGFGGLPHGALFARR